MVMVWTSVNDDKLILVDKTVEFLQGEFCPVGSEPLWSADYFRWKLGPKNPAGNGFVSLAFADDKVVGVVSLTKKRILIDGVESIGGEVGDSYSSAIARRKSRPAQLSVLDSDPKSYVNRSIFGRLASEVRARAEAEGISLTYGTPNSNAYPGWVNRLGYFDLKELCNRSYSRPTSEFAIRRYPVLYAYRNILRRVERLLLRAQGFRSPVGPRKRYQMIVGIPSATVLDEFWKRVKPARGFSLVRDSRYWRHRYQEHPIVNYSFLCIWENEILVGLVVTRVATVGDGKRVAYLAEWLITERVDFSWILTTVIDYHRDSGIEMFNFWASSFSRPAKVARRNLFFSKHAIPIILANTDQARKVRSQPAAIQFYLGSTDAV